MEDVELLERSAIDAAIKFDWSLAIVFNKKIISIDKNNVASYLRNGFANLQLKNYVEAKKYYKKALKLQPANSVARNNMEKIKILELKKGKKTTDEHFHLDPNLFLETTGKTRAIHLVNLGQKNILAQVNIGQELYLKPKSKKIEARTKDNEYVGRLPDDISRRLLFFIKAESRYSSFVKEISLNRVIIFVREEKKGTKVARYLSFPSNIQTNNLPDLNSDKNEEEETEEISGSDIEKLAETLTQEDKEYLPYKPPEEEEE